MAQAPGEAIFTEAVLMENLPKKVADAAQRHFGHENVRRAMRLYIVKGKILTA